MENNDETGIAPGAEQTVLEQSQPSAQKERKRVIGRPIQAGEMARAMQLSAARAKALRKEARAKMLRALTEKLDLGEELYKAMKTCDEKYLNMIEKATHMVGLQHDQSEEALAKRFDIKSDNRLSGSLEVTVKGLSDE